MIETIRTAWSWTGIVPTEVIKANPFGNLIVKAADAAYWRICPEMLTCEKIADSDRPYEKVWNSQNFQLDWDMAKLASIAEQNLGLPEHGRCYCFKLSPVLGGTYEVGNMTSITMEELISFSGDLAKQIKDVPDGGKVEIKWIQ